MDYNDIPVFIRVVETSSFTKAAESLGVQKSSVSRSLSRLEADLGVRLVQRTTRQLGLTDAGQNFYERVRGALTGFDEAAATVRELGTEPRGVVRMTAPPDSGSLGLAEAITTFMQQYPAVVIEIELSARLADLVAEGFDLALRAGRLLDSSLIAKKISTLDLVLLASPAYLKRRGRPRTVAQLADHECVLFRGRGGSVSWTLTTADSDETIDVRGRLNTNEASFVVRAAIAGAGIAALPAQLVRDAILRKDLEVVLPEYRMQGPELHAVLPSAAFVPSRVVLLRDHIVRELSAVAVAAHQECTAHHAQYGARAATTPRPTAPDTRPKKLVKTR